MIFKLSNLHRFFFTYLCPRFYGGPPAAPTETTSTVNQNTIPAQLMPYATGMLSAAKNQLFTQNAKGKITGFQPYKPYSTNTQDYVSPFSSMQLGAQQQAANLQVPGQFAPASGIAGVSSMNAMNAGAQFGQQATDPNATAAYMSPYMDNVVQQQMRQANRNYDISGTTQMGQATRAGAFGGSREALMASENERNRNMELANIQASGTENAFQNAQAQQQFGANLGLQGAQAGIQGAQTLGQLGSSQLAAEQGVIGTQNTMGGQQQAQNQKAIDQAILNYQNAQQQPYLALGTFSNLIHGTPTGNLSTQTYQAQPSTLSQIGGALGSAGSLYGAATAKAGGGIIQAYAEGGSVEGSIESQLNDMDDAHLQETIQTSTSASIKGMATRILNERQMESAGGMARGGIVGYNGEDESLVKRDPYWDLTHNKSEAGRLDTGTFLNPKGIAHKAAVASTIAGKKTIEGIKETYGRSRLSGLPYKAAVASTIAGEKAIEGIKEAYGVSDRVAKFLLYRDSDNPLESTKEPTKEAQPAPTGIAQPPIASTANLPGSVAEGVSNKMNLANSSGIAGVNPDRDKNSIDLASREVGKAISAGGYDAPVESNAAPEPSQAVAAQSAPSTALSDLYAASDKEDTAAAGKTPQEIMAEQTAKREAAGIESPEAASTEERKKIMEERSNAEVERKRQMYMRMAEFFSNWGSTPGAPLAAGLKSMKETLPGVMDDSKAHIKLMRDINKSETELNHAVRLEKMGLWTEAAGIKENASNRILKHKEAVIGLALDKEKRDEKSAQEIKLEQMQQGGANYRTETAVAGRESDSTKQAQVLINERASLQQSISGIGFAKPSKEERERMGRRIQEIDEKLRGGTGVSQPAQAYPGFTPQEEALYKSTYGAK